MSLDSMALTQYRGQGKCWEVACYRETANRYKEEVRSWAKRINWTVFENQRSIKVRGNYGVKCRNQ